MKRKEILDKLKQNRLELIDHYGVESLLLFGSVARDESRPDSDVDLLVGFKEPIGLFQFIDLQQRLEAILNCKVDLGTKRSLKDQLKEQVMQEAILVV